MEKRIAYMHFQSVKAVAKAMDPHLKTIETLKKKALALKEEYEVKQAKLKAELDEKASKVKQEYDACQTQIDALEAGILSVTGFHVAELVKKVIEPTGKTDAKTGKPIKVTKYIPTDIVSYDDNTKEYVVSVGEGTTEAPTQEAAPEAEAPATENQPGSDFDNDSQELEIHEEESEREAAEAEAVESEHNQMPWEQ